MDFSNVKSFMDDLTARFVPGDVISIYHKNYEVYRYAAGYADRENGVRMTGNELMHIYSCTKPSTVVAALQLLEKGKILLTDPLYAYMPAFKHLTYRDLNGGIVPATQPITIWNLFTMTSGINYDALPDMFKRVSDATNGRMGTVDVANAIAGEPLSFDPGTHWLYGRSHDVLAALVEVVSGMRYQDYIRKNVFEPLGIKDAYYHLTDAIKPRMAQQYVRRAEGEDVSDIVRAQAAGDTLGGAVRNCGLKNSHTFGPDYDSGGAGLIISVPDYARFASMLANGGVGPGGARILARSTIELMRTNQLSGQLQYDFNWAHLRGYGYGLGVRTCIDTGKASSIGSLGEFGWCGAAGAMLMADPDRGISAFYAHHMLNPMEPYYMPRLRNVIYSCFGE